MTSGERGRVLVTGASGFIGRWSVPALLALGYEVHAVTSPRRADMASLPQLSGAHLHAVDLFDSSAVAALLEAVGATHLLHFAWIATPGAYWTSPDNERWLAASRELLKRFTQVGGRRVVSAGTCAEYDWALAERCVERSSPLMLGTGATDYARCKIALFETLEQWRAGVGCSAATGRIFFQYGPDEHRDRLVPAVITQLLAGHEALCTHGSQVRSFLHVADVGAAFAALLASEVEGAVNIGSAQSVTLAEVIGYIARSLGRSDLVRLGARPAPANEPQVLLPDVTRLGNEVNWTPQFSLESGLDDAIEWWRRHE